jgi:hypothetical protein
MVAFECALGRACMERDAERAQAKIVWQDYLDRMRAFTSGSKHYINFTRTLEERSSFPYRRQTWRCGR